MTKPGNDEGRPDEPAQVADGTTPHKVNHSEDNSTAGELPALAYARRGWIPVPSTRDGKEPLVKIKDRVTIPTPEQIREWWTTWPDAGVAILTGARSGLVVVDLDGLEGEASWAKLEGSHGPFPPTMEVRTRRGRHLYFQHPGIKILTRRSEYFYPWGLDQEQAWGVDVRGDGGLVIAPPSQDRVLVNDLDPAPLPTGLVGPMSTSKGELAGPRMELELGEAEGWLTGGDICPALLRVLDEYAGHRADVRRLQVKILRHGEQGHRGARAAWYRLRDWYIGDCDRDGAEEWADLATGAPKEIKSRTPADRRGCCLLPAPTLAQLLARRGGR
jgi:hypothetical protein